MDEPTPTINVSVDREIVADFGDIGLPEITSAEEGATQRDASRDLIMLGKFARFYQCRLNVAGVALGRVQPVAGCVDDLERLSTELSQPQSEDD